MVAGFCRDHGLFLVSDEVYREFVYDGQKAISALAIATSSRDLYGALIAVGVLGMWLFQILENIGMTVGMMPITGIPLPFMSFGSSAMVTNLGGVGLLLSVWSRRYGA